MRIAFVVGTFPLVSETFILRQITGLIDLGHEVDIYADHRPSADMPVHPEVDRYGLLERTTYVDGPPESTTWEMPLWPLRGETWVPGSAAAIPNEERALRAVPVAIDCLRTVPRLALRALDPDEYGYQAASLSTLYRLHALSRRPARYDVIHAHFGPVGNSFRFVRELWGAPFVVTFHGYDFSAVPRREGRGAYARLFETADAVIGVNEHMRAMLEQMGCPPRKFRRHPCGVDTAQHPFRSRGAQAGGTVRLLTVGRLVEKKGIEHSLRAFAAVHEAHRELRYDIVGDGPLRAKLERLVMELGLAQAVTFHGALPAPEVRSLMNEAHLFALASVTAADGDQEGIPVSLMEAMASGLPVLSTRHSGIPELVVDGESGLLAPEGDVPSLAVHLTWLVEHPDAWAGMGRRGREQIETNYDAKRLDEQLVRLYQDVIRSCDPGAEPRSRETKGAASFDGGPTIGRASDEV
jgi:colanic acid/amylovoran biosynthesis glycosyltransferase